jgi:hypothetical protein
MATPNGSALPLRYLARPVNYLRARVARRAT